MHSGAMDRRLVLQCSEWFRVFEVRRVGQGPWIECRWLKCMAGQTCRSSWKDRSSECEQHIKVTNILFDHHRQRLWIFLDRWSSFLFMFRHTALNGKMWQERRYDEFICDWQEKANP